MTASAVEGQTSLGPDPAGSCMMDEVSYWRLSGGADFEVCAAHVRSRPIADIDEQWHCYCNPPRKCINGSAGKST